MDSILVVADSIYGLLLLVATVLAALQSHRDLGIAKRLVILGAIVMAARWLTWSISTDTSWEYRAVAGALLGAALFTLVPAALHWIEERLLVTEEPSRVAPKMEPHPLVFEAQFKELSALREFLSNDDMVARQEFDIPAIMDKNIGIQQLRIMFFRAGNKAMFPYQIYAQDGGWIVMVREGNYNASRGKINMGEFYRQ